MNDNNTQERILWENRIKQARVPRILAEKLALQIQRITASEQINQRESFSRYIDWVAALPWEVVTSETLDIIQVKTILDKNHYGLESLKKRILEYLSVLVLERKKGIISFHAPILLFVGLAGTGKTSIARSIAEAMGRKFSRIAFGGLSSALDLRGLSKTQLEAEPGLIIKALRETQCKNPVILLDEIDRVSPDSRDAIMGVLLELLDPAQNAHFTDHYIDYPFDLSQALFIATANTTQHIATAVLDRLEIIQMPSYSDDEKIVIAQNYILPHLLKESGIEQGTITIDQTVFKKIARQSGYDPGIRSVERAIEMIVRRVAFQLISQKGTTFNITEQNMQEYLE